MNDDELLDAILYICSKLGFDVHMSNDQNIYEYYAIALTGQQLTLNISPTTSFKYSIQDYTNMIVDVKSTRPKFRWRYASSKLMLDILVNASSFIPIARFYDDVIDWRIANPFFKHNELLKCNSICEFKINADLICSADFSKKCNIFFKKKGWVN